MLPKGSLGVRFSSRDFYLPEAAEAVPKVTPRHHANGCRTTIDENKKDWSVKSNVGLHQHVLRTCYHSMMGARDVGFDRASLRPIVRCLAAAGWLVSWL